MQNLLSSTADVTNSISFSTLGCPAWDIDQILSGAIDYGYNSVELRGYLDTMNLAEAGPFRTENRVATRDRFVDSGIAFSCVSSSAVVVKGDTDEVKRNAELARDLHCSRVRVFGGRLDDTVPRESALQRAADNLREFGDIAASAGVTIVLETHDSFSTGKSVAELIALTKHRHVYSLWDLHHPYREGESIVETGTYLMPTVGHTHIKDSRPDTGYCLPDDGDIPLAAMVRYLIENGYRGPISLEWEKRWHPEIADPEVAFPAYARAIRQYLELANSGT